MPHPSPASFCAVAVPSPLPRCFDYRIPEHLLSSGLAPGCRVEVSFSGRRLVGVVCELKQHSDFDPARVKPIDRILDAQALLPPSLLELLQWAATYYHQPIGEVMQAALPVLLRQGEPALLRGENCWQVTIAGLALAEDALKRAPKQAALLNWLRQRGPTPAAAMRAAEHSTATAKALEEKGLVENFEQLPRTGDPAPLQSAPPLTQEQEGVLQSLGSGASGTFLLDGVTGSGKTEIYLQAVARTIASGKQALILVPEIGLTPQTLRRFEQRFAGPIALLHSGLNDSERLQAWMMAARGVAPVVIGTRSAIFTPMPSLGLIVVDEEHDLSFKQQDGFHYSARDLAVLRGHMLEIPVVLGSATPSLETLHNAQAGRYTHLRLRERVGDARLPQRELVDCRGAPLEQGLSKRVLEALQTTLEEGGQAMLFLNRRGFAPLLQCHDCGWIAECPHCDARLNIHLSRHQALCHHCDHSQAIAESCPHCHSPRLAWIGAGTERIEQFLSSRFADARVIRIDRDSTQRKEAMNDYLKEIRAGRPCILLGTQMLAKGHHFPNVSLAVIVDVDNGLFGADFRSLERTGQLITQVAGRAGRGERPGTVILQTHCADHPLFAHLLEKPYHEFAEQLLRQRQLGKLPPFSHMALLRANGPSATSVERFLGDCRRWLQRQCQPDILQVLGPMPALLERRNNRYRFYLQLNAPSRQKLQQTLQQLQGFLQQRKQDRYLRWAIDVDPQDLS